MYIAHTPYGVISLDPRATAEAAIVNFLTAAETLISLGDMTQAELRLRDALKQADATFGHNSRVVRHVLYTMADFYRSQGRTDQLETIQKRIELMGVETESAEPDKSPNNSYGSLLAIKRQHERPPADTKLNPARMPIEVRKACQILGLDLDDVNEVNVKHAWKQAVSDPSVHPDLGGISEVAVLLNSSRDTVLRWLEDQQPKLLKKFGRMAGHQ